MSFGLLLLLLVNFGISWINAIFVGRSWADSKVVGGWVRFITWCAAIMSASGFTWCYLTVLALGAGAFGWLPPQYVKAALELGYVIIIFPILGSGFGIWIDSLTTAYRERDALSIGVGAWNTYAQIHNTCEAISILPDVFSDLGKTLGGGDSDDAAGRLALVVFLLVILALLAGVFTTVAIVRSTAREYSRNVLSGLQARA